MTHPEIWTMFFASIAGFGIGVLVGLAYFSAVRLTAEMVVVTSRPIWAITLTMGRLALLVIVFVLATRLGGFVIISILAGILAGRHLIVRRDRSADR